MRKGFLGYTSVTVLGPVRSRGGAHAERRQELGLGHLLLDRLYIKTLPDSDAHRDARCRRDRVWQHPGHVPDARLRYPGHCGISYLFYVLVQTRSSELSLRGTFIEHIDHTELYFFLQYPTFSRTRRTSHGITIQRS